MADDGALLERVDTESGKKERFEDDRTVFVGRLSKAATEADVRALFQGCGTVSRVSLPRHRASGRPMGVAYVEFERSESVPRACRLDGRAFMDSDVKVKPASMGGKRAPVKHHGKGMAKADDDCTVHVGNLSFATDEGTLAKEFGRCGKIVRINIPLWHNTGRKRGFALVEFAAREDSRKAIEKMSGATIDGRTVTVSQYKPLQQEPKKKPAKRAAAAAAAPPKRTKAEENDASGDSGSDEDDDEAPEPKKRKEETKDDDDLADGEEEDGED